MKLYVKNYSAARLVIPGVGTFADTTDWQLIAGVENVFAHENGTDEIAELNKLKAAGVLDYAFVPEDYETGKTGALSLTVSAPRGDLAGVDSSPYTITGGVPLPLGAQLLTATLDDHVDFSGGDLSEVSVTLGVTGNDDAFETALSVFDNVGRRVLQDSDVGTYIGGEELVIKMTAVDDDLLAAETGLIVLTVTYVIGATPPA